LLWIVPAFVRALRSPRGDLVPSTEFTWSIVIVPRYEILRQASVLLGPLGHEKTQPSRYLNRADHGGLSYPALLRRLSSRLRESSRVPVQRPVRAVSVAYEEIKDPTLNLGAYQGQMEEFFPAPHWSLTTASGCFHRAAAGAGRAARASRWAWPVRARGAVPPGGRGSS